MKTRTLVIALVIALVLCGCSKSENVESTADYGPSAEVARPELAVPAQEVATRPAVDGGVLSEFARRGGAECIVTRAESVDGIFHFEWESPEDRSWARGEVMAAVMSVLRGYGGYVGGFEIVRTHSEGSNRITIAGTDYNAWLDGAINDPVFLERCGLGY